MKDKPGYSSSLHQPGFRGYISEFDGLRAIGLCFVLLNHFTVDGMSQYLFQVGNMGWIAMDSFFVMSGFLITGILLDSRDNPKYFSTYYVRRSLRIFPLYYAVLILWWFVSRHTNYGLDYSVLTRYWGSPIWFYLYVGNIRETIVNSWPNTLGYGPLWSLQIEEQFYLLFPLAIAWMRRDHLKRLLMAAVFISPALRIAGYLWHPNNPFLQYVELPTHCEGLALGALIAFRFRSGPWKISKKFLTICMLVLLGGAAIGSIASTWGTRNQAWGSSWDRLAGYSISSFGCACLILWLISFRGSRYTSWLRIPPLQYLGKISYGVYLLHTFAMWAVLDLSKKHILHFHKNDPRYIFATTGLSIALASISWYCFEKPVLKLKDRFTYSRKARKATVPIPLKQGETHVISNAIAPQAELKPSMFMANQLQRRIYSSVLLALTLFIALVILRHPLATNDGPVHVAFAHLMLTLQHSGYPLQDQAYTLQLRPNPNLAVYFLMAGLMHIFTPAFAESIIQLLCIVGPVAAAYFALRVIAPQNAWLSLLILPVSLNQLFFLGLYNHCMSTAAFFLVIGTYFWMTKSPSYGRAIALSATLILAFFCHASGYISSYAGVATLAGTAAFLDYRRQQQIVKSLWIQRYAIAALLAPLPLVVLFLGAGDNGITAYGLNPIKRLKQFGEFHLLAVNFPSTDRFVGMVMGAVLTLGFAIVSFRILRRRLNLSQSRRDQAIGLVAATLVAMVIMFVFPDSAGGGWTHFHRFEVYSYFWMVLALAFNNFSTRQAWAFFSLGALSGIILISSTVTRQVMIQHQLAPLADVDHLIGNHCSIAPIVMELSPELENHAVAYEDYQPYFQAASKLELTGDRVVLFNYLARLSPYPVHFRPQIEPQAHLFLWKPGQHETKIEKVDVSGFETSSGMPVDYILVWGHPDHASASLQQQVRNALINFSLIYSSPDSRVTLYRKTNSNSSCQVNENTSGLTQSKLSQAMEVPNAAIPR